jgi:hypothetical protein
MSGGSSGGGSSSSLDPAMRDAFLANATRATGVAENLGARQFAGYNPAQADALRYSQQFADPSGIAFTGMDKAFTQAQNAANYQPTNASGMGYTAAQANAASLNRNAVRDINAERIAAERIAADRVSGANVTSEALGQIAPQARANIRDVNASSFLNQNIQQYMNPYTQQVVDTSLADLERSRQLAQQQGSAQAVRAKAFGGSRQGVAEAETNRAFAEQAARTSAGLRSQGFDTASRLSEADLARQMQAQQLNQGQDAATTQQSLALAGQFGLANQQAALEAARANQATGLTAAQSNQTTGLQAQTSNQGMDFNVGQMNTANQQQTNLANQAALNQAAQFGAAAQNQANLANQQAGLAANQQRLGASGQMADISGNYQQMGFAGANQMLGIGNQAQAQTQAQLDAARNLELERQQIINQALGLNVGGGSGAISTSAQESRQGLLGLLGL